MSAGQLDLEIEQGASFSCTLIWTAADTTPVPIDLTGATAEMQIRDKQGGRIYADLTTENSKLVLGTTNGQIQILLSAADTTLLDKRRLKYDLEVTSLTFGTARVIEGNVFVSPNITQSLGEPVVT